MTVRKVIPRQKAERDVDDAIDHYFEEGGADVALRFIDELEAAFRHLAAHAESGSLRYATALDLPGLRCWSLQHFPFLIFYVVNDGIVDVWRVLHGKRDIPETMRVEQLSKL
jgi:toxin ParE1/3/4